jgi:hypothetical protein
MNMAAIADHYVLCGPKLPFEIDANFFLPKYDDRYVVVDLVLICTSRGETCPSGYYILGATDHESKKINNRNIGGSFSPSLYLCVKKMLVKDLKKMGASPILDVRVQYQTEAIPPGYTKLEKTTGGSPGKLHSGLGVRSKYIYILRDQVDKIIELEKEQGMKTMKQLPICDVQIVPFPTEDIPSESNNNNNKNPSNSIDIVRKNNSKVKNAASNSEHTTNAYQGSNYVQKMKKLPIGCRLSNRPLRDGKSWGESGQRIELILKYREETRSVMDIPYKAEVLDRYTKSSNENDNDKAKSFNDLPKQFTEFCYPRGLRLLYSPKGWAGVPGPSFFSWSMTDANLGTNYVTSLVFYEKLFGDKKKQGESKIIEENNAGDYNVLNTFIQIAKKSEFLDKHILENYQSNVRNNLFVPKILNVVSRYCFYQGFQEFLTQLFRVSLSESKLPIEDYIVQFFNCVPVPKFSSRGGLQLTYDGTRKSQAVATFQLDSLNEYGVTDFDYQVLFKCLSVPNIFHAIALILLEQKIIFHSKHNCILTPLIHAILALIFPIKWTGIYIPLCSTSLIAVLDAPVPFLIGLGSTEVCNVNALADDIYTVDMDNDKILGGPKDAKITNETLPSPIVTLIGKRLKCIIDKASIKDMNMDNILDSDSKDWSNSAYAFRLAVPPSLSNVDMDLSKIVPVSEKKVRDSFLRFMGLILFAVPKYLKNCNNNTKKGEDEIKTEAEKEASKQSTLLQKDEDFLELEDMFKLNDYIASSPNDMVPFLKQFTQTQSFVRFIAQVYNFYNVPINRSNTNSKRKMKVNNEALLQQYRIQFFSHISNYVYISSPSNKNKTSEKSKKNAIHIYNDGGGDDKTEDTLFEQIGTKMKVEDKLLQFHKKHYARHSASSSIDGTKIGSIGSKSKNRTHLKKIKGPVDSISRKKCLEKKLPNVARPFKYNDKFPLLKDDILSDAYNYYVNKFTTVPTGFVKHVDDITEINEEHLNDIAFEIVV